jgi:hypothetical protein
MEKNIFSLIYRSEFSCPRLLVWQIDKDLVWEACGTDESIMTGCNSDERNEQIK